MGNNDEKTFKDIFSNSDDTTTQTFGDILKNNEKEEDNSLTFDNLFDQATKYQDEETDDNTLDTTDDNFNLIEEEGSLPSEEFSEEIDDTSTTDETGTSSIFAPEVPNPFFSSEPVEEDSTIAPSVENPFLQEDDSTQSTIDSSLDVSINPFISVESSEQSSNSNNENIASIETYTSETTIENPFFKNTSTEVTSENPFFDNTIDNSPQIISTFEEQKPTVELNTIEESINSNPFFDIETTNTSNDNSIEVEPVIQIPNSNPFFEDSTKNTSNEISTVVENAQIPSSNPFFEETTPKSASPFFEEPIKSEENPFFQNQINLIENQIPSTPKGNIDITKSKHYNVKIVKKKEPLIKTIIGVLSYALFIWLLLVGVALLAYVLDIKIRAAKGDYSSPTFNAYVVLTGSMLPEIKVNDVVVTKKVDASTLKENDVITFASADSRYLGTIITHRIIKINYSETEGYTFQTKGDNNNVADNALVPANNIYGKVILRIPKLGYLQEFLATDGGWIVVILIPCLTVMSYDTVKLIKGMKRKKYKNIKVQK